MASFPVKQHRSVCRLSSLELFTTDMCFIRALWHQITLFILLLFSHCLLHQVTQKENLDCSLFGCYGTIFAIPAGTSPQCCFPQKCRNRIFRGKLTYLTKCLSGEGLWTLSLRQSITWRPAQVGDTEGGSWRLRPLQLQFPAWPHERAT